MSKCGLPSCLKERENAFLLTEQVHISFNYSQEFHKKTITKKLYIND